MWLIWTLSEIDRGWGLITCTVSEFRTRSGTDYLGLFRLGNPYGITGGWRYGGIIINLASGDSDSMRLSAGDKLVPQYIHVLHVGWRSLPVVTAIAHLSR